jgi:hypothetical protein
MNQTCLLLFFSVGRVCGLKSKKKNEQKEEGVALVRTLMQQWLTKTRIPQRRGLVFGGTAALSQTRRR